MHDIQGRSGFDTATARKRSHSSWRKGCLLGLFLVGGCAWMIASAATPGCALDPLTGTNFLSLHVGGFSLFVTWNAYGCR